MLWCVCIFVERARVVRLCQWLTDIGGHTLRAFSVKLFGQQVQNYGRLIEYERDIHIICVERQFGQKLHTALLYIRYICVQTHFPTHFQNSVSFMSTFFCNPQYTHKHTDKQVHIAYAGVDSLTHQTTTERSREATGNRCARIAVPHTNTNTHTHIPCENHNNPR